jgi:hypothetical protein
MQLAVLRRARFGRSSEKLDHAIEQLELLIGELEAYASAAEARDTAGDPRIKQPIRGRFKIRVKSGHNGRQSKKVALNQRLGVPLWQPKTPHANRRRRVLTVVSENGSADGRPRGTCFQQNRGSSRSSMKVNLCGQGRDLTSTQLVTTFYTYPQPTPSQHPLARPAQAPR